MSIEQMDAFEIEQLNRDVEKLTKNSDIIFVRLR